MKLKDFFAMWFMFSDYKLMIIDKETGKVYYDLYKNKEIWDKDVIYLYFDNNKLSIKIV